MHDALRYTVNSFGSIPPVNGNYIMLDGWVIEHNPELAKRVFLEECLHFLDIKLGFTQRPEWIEAAQKQLAVMNKGAAATIAQAHNNEKATYTGEAYKDFVAQSRELLVDYFHVRNYLHAQRQFHFFKPSVEAVRKQMSALFPYIHTLCEAFEAELAKRGQSPNQPGL